MGAKSVFSIALCCILSNLVISISAPEYKDTFFNDKNGVRWWNTVPEFSNTYQLVKRSAGSANEEKSKVESVCDIPECNCQHAKHSIWIIVNCTFDNRQDVELKAGFIPTTANDVTLTGAGRVRASARAFTALVDLSRLRVQDADDVRFSRHAFLNLTAPNLLLEVLSCGTVHVDTLALKNMKGTATVNISACGEVYIGKESFSRPISISISDVPKLELSEGAFLFDMPYNHHGPVTKIHFKNVSVENLPKNTFQSSAAEIFFQLTDVKTVHREAFNTIKINAVIAINSSFQHIMEEAFAQKILIHTLKLYNCSIVTLESRAVLSSATNLIIQHSSISEVASGAINITVATATITDNDFGTFHSRGFDLQSWNTVRVERNFFHHIERAAIVCPSAPRKSPNNTNFEFTFIENEFLTAEPGSLNFVGDVQDFQKTVVYDKNYFAEECNCGIYNWLHSVFDNNSSHINDIANKSFCTVNKNIALCFNVDEGNMLVKNFTDKVCGSQSAINCEPSNGNSKGPVGEVINTRFHNRTNKFDEDKRKADYMNKKIVWFLLIISVCGIVIIVLVTVFAWCRQRGHCLCATNSVVSSRSSCTAFCDRFFNINYGIATAGSISRVPIKDYTESHRLNEMRTLYIEDPPVDIDNSLEVLVDTADKGTQTLPEELTQDLLESLRMKLDIPETYEEAREMIEHLYDLITVEEYCNANINNSTENKIDTPREEQDDLYDVIQVPQRPAMRSGRNKECKSVGTKTPSLEKLIPFSPYTRSTALSHEYFEPRDCTIHLYSQLPGDKTAKNTPDVLAERPTSRPLSYLRVIGEKLYDNNTREPPERQASTSGFLNFGAGGTHKSNKSSKSSGSSNSANKMANRPLPAKPGDPGEGTSFLKR